MNANIINILLQVLGALPNVIGDVEAVLHANWQHPTVQGAVTSVAALNDLVQKVAAAKAAPVPADPAVQTVA